MTDPYLDSLSLREEMPRLATQARLIYLGLEEFLRRNPQPILSSKSILDIGSGPGILTSLLAKNFPSAKVTGVDRSQEMIKFSQVSNSKIEWILGDAAKLPFPDQSIQLVQHSFLIQHLPHLEQVLLEIHRVLELKGLVFFLEPLVEKNQADPLIIELIHAYNQHLRLNPESLNKAEDFYRTKGYQLIASDDISISAKGTDDEAVLDYPRIKIGRMAAWSLLSHIGQLLNLRELYGECLELYMAKKINIQEFSYAVRLYQKIH